jgi:hypothetical protein
MPRADKRRPANGPTPTPSNGQSAEIAPPRLTKVFMFPKQSAATCASSTQDGRF